MNKHLVLVGMMGSGKTTVGTWLHRHLRQLQYCDTDTLIAESEKRTIPEIFRDAGEPHFRAREREIIRELLSETRPASILSTGGGLFIDLQNRRALLRNGVVFYLHASARELAARTEKAVHRPLLHGKDHLSELREKLAARDTAYRQAHHTVEVGGRSVDEIGKEILAHWKTHHEP